ncbi:MAG: hypothetical protein VW405_02580 [Rhodospirillaceae bacterium]
MKVRLDTIELNEDEVVALKAAGYDTHEARKAFCSAAVKHAVHEAIEKHESVVKAHRRAELEKARKRLAELEKPLTTDGKP